MFVITIDEFVISRDTHGCYCIHDTLHNTNMYCNTLKGTVDYLYEQSGYRYFKNYFNNKIAK